MRDAHSISPHISPISRYISPISPLYLPISLLYLPCISAVQASEAEQRERGDAARQDNAKLLSDLQEVSQLIELLEVRPISPMHLP